MWIFFFSVDIFWDFWGYLVDKCHFFHRPRLRCKGLRAGRSIGRCRESSRPLGGNLGASPSIFTLVNNYSQYPRGYDSRMRSTLGRMAPTIGGRASERAGEAGKTV